MTSLFIDMPDYAGISLDNTLLYIIVKYSVVKL